MENAIKTVGVVVFSDRSVLLVRHKSEAGHLNDSYGLPAGRILQDETESAAAIRELLEETGLTTTESNLIQIQREYSATIKRKDDTDKFFSMHVFVATSVQGDLKESEETCPEWVSLSDLTKKNLLPNVAKAIEDAGNKCNADK